MRWMHTGETEPAPAACDSHVGHLSVPGSRVPRKSRNPAALVEKDASEVPSGLVGLLLGHYPCLPGLSFQPQDSLRLAPV